MNILSISSVLSSDDNVLQRVAMLQRIAVCSGALQCVAVRCSVLQCLHCAAVCCIV